MDSNERRSVVACVLACCLACGISPLAPAFGEEKKPDVRPSFDPGPVRKRAGELRNIVRAIAEERRALREAGRKWEEEKKALESRLKGLSIRQSVLEMRHEKARRTVEDLDKERKRLTDRKTEMQALLHGCGEALKRDAVKLKNCVLASFPWRREERDTAAEKVVQRAKNPERSLPERFRLLWERLTEESALLRTFETGALPGVEGATRKILPSLRVGRTVVLQYDPESGEARALWKGKDGKDRALKIGGSSADNVRAAVEIARRKRAPALVSLPVPKDLIKAGEENPIGTGSSQAGKKEEGGR